MSDLESKISKIPEFIFYNNLDETTETEKIALSEYLSGCTSCTQYYPIESYIRKIIYNYDKLKDHFGNSSYSKYCRYLKYWINKKKKSYELTYHSQKKYWNDCIPCLWKNLQAKNLNTHGKCDLDDEKYSNAILSMKRELDWFCSIKTELGNSQEIKTNREDCINFNNKKDYYLTSFLQMLSSIPNNTYLEPHFFDIDNNCSLSKISTIFSDITCPSDDNTQVVPTQDCSSEVAEALSSATQCIKSEPCPEQNATEDLTCNSLYQVALSICITFFLTILFCFLLYNFTPLGHWLHNRLRKKNILQKNLDHKNEQEILESLSRNSDRIIENNEYYITYERF
ncbi:PIR Superfamily Protein [Plasmodium ovale wallikeri]|uniref:PIR Superfamily Protein n=2 Tax=Plasmodium ovale TaxID=36330 RepID=A0A1A8ZTP8_PLAOA|nr:PIR Superfamily Protein [Plasmodium ovale wallikeri]SBT56672.1 PIR Superfamily Protein [Plasmodium ovale wallikeri]SBT79054.1 PIR protein [Plasmodium ovale]